ncbi:MAG: Uma2 family endonuclease [Dolichospermum sp.]
MIITEIPTQLLTNNWITATWDEYIQVIENFADKKAKSYYHHGKMRIEISPIGNDHASDHSIIIFAVNLFATIKGIKFNSKDNCTYRKIGFQEVQPDVSYYIAEKANAIPYGTSIVNLDVYPVPDLVIEVANSSLADNQGEKRLMYEDMGIPEYWVLDVQNLQIIPFIIENGGSRRINESQVLPGLKMSLLNEALRKTRQMDHSQVCAWLLSQFQQ